MMQRFLALASALVLLSACSGGGASPSTSPLGGALRPTAAPSASSLVPTTFVFGRLPATSSTARHANYVTANVASVTIALDLINGGAPPAGITTAVTTNVSLASCPCTVAGPAVPPGSDQFTLTAYDGQNGGGHVVSTAMPTLTIVANHPNSNTITLNGVPASFTIVPPSATAGTAFGSPQPISVTVKDADGNTIMGAYANPVTLSDGDASGATTLATSGSDSPPSGELISSSDVATLAYTGLAIAPATIGASASGATGGSGTFAPVLQPIGPSTLTGGVYVNAFGAGSPVTFTAGETGWTNAPYNRSLTAALSPACSTIATVTPSSGTTFTPTLVASPANGTCTLTLSDGAGQQLVIPIGYQQFSYTGSDQSFPVPAGVTQIVVTAAGAQGGSNASAGGKGGSVTAQIPVSSGSLTIVVGQMGSSDGSATYGGGGATGSPLFGGSSGGGYSGVFQSGTPLVVAGGGGGGGAGGPNGAGDVGGAGGQVGAAGSPASGNVGFGGGGGQASTGGAGGAGATDGGCVGTCGAGANGTSLAGGSGGSAGGGVNSGAGGGGGYFGGGGGGAGNESGGGGGGSSFVASPIGTPTYTSGTQSGNGQVVITW